MIQSLVHGLPGGYGKGSVDDAREVGHGNANSGGFKVGFDGGHGDSGFGGRGQTESFSSLQHGSTRNSHSDGIHFGSTKGSIGADYGFSHSNVDSNSDYAIHGSNQNGLNRGHHTDEGLNSKTFADDHRGTVTSPAGNGHSTGTVFQNGNLGHGNSDRNTGRHESEFESGVGGRGTSFGSTQNRGHGQGTSFGSTKNHGHGNGASFGGHDHSSEFGHVHSSGCGHGHSSHSFGFGSSSNAGEHVKGHKGDYKILRSVCNSINNIYKYIFTGSHY